jgi:hypothetical protein
VTDDLFGRLEVIDVSDPESPTIVGVTDIPAAWRVAAAGDHAYVLGESSGIAGLSVVDITDPQNPLVVGLVNLPGEPANVMVTGGHAYIAGGEQGLLVVDVSDPPNPVIVGSVDTPGIAVGVAVAGMYAYVADFDAGLMILDISDPSNPTHIEALDTPERPYEVAVSGSRVYLGGPSLMVVDVSDPLEPRFVGNLRSTIYSADYMAVSEDYLYLAATSGFWVLPAQCEFQSDVPDIGGRHPAMRIQVAPSPGPQGATIRFQTRTEGRARVAIYDPSGRLIRELFDGVLRAGDHDIRWEGLDEMGNLVPKGVYFIRASAPDGVGTARFVATG